MASYQGIIRSKEVVRSGRRRRFFHAAEMCFAVAMRLIPRRYRFGTAIFIARATVPLFRLTEVYQVQLTTKVDGPYEITLHFILNALTKNGTRFDPVVAVKGYEELKRAYAAGRGVLVIGPHAALTLLMVRLFYDDGFDPVVITPDPRMRVGGTTVTARTVEPSSTFLVKARSRLRRGEVVCAMPDRAEHHGARTVEFATAKGRVIVAPALFQVAVRCQAEVVFAEVHVEGRGLAGTIVAPSPASVGAVSALTEDFMAFVRGHVDDRLANLKAEEC
jgi:hypothetical protein